MRRIKFRGKCVADSKYAGQWVYGGYSEPQEDCKQNEGLITVYLGGSSTCKYHVIPNTVGQFTGLRDSIGREIYEGDIIRSFDSKGEPIIHYLLYDNEEAGFVAILKGSAKGDFGYGRCYQQWITECEKEVIGNIHDNPGLLKTKVI